MVDQQPQALPVHRSLHTTKGNHPTLRNSPKKVMALVMGPLPHLAKLMLLLTMRLLLEAI